MLLLHEERASELTVASPPREGRGIALFVVASVLGHVALVAAAPSLSEPHRLEPVAEDLVFMELAPEPARVEPALPEPEQVEEVEEVKVPEPVAAVTRVPTPRPVEVAPEPVAEPETPVEDAVDEPPAAVAEATQEGSGVAETVATAAGGLAVDRAAGAGTAGRPDGAARTAPAPRTLDPNALRAWRLSAMRVLGRPQPTLAMRRTGLDGVVVVAFTVDPAGRIRGVRLFRSSGHEIVDEAALEYARARRELPAPPTPWQTREIRLPIRYRAQG